MTSTAVPTPAGAIRTSFIGRAVGAGLAALSGLLVPLAALHGQQKAPGDPPSPEHDLAVFEGRYEYRDGLTLGIVAAGGRLVAIVGDAKYPLQYVAPDTFANGTGDRIPFVRDGTGRVMAFQERGGTFRRVSRSVSPELRRLLVPRPLGPDGQPQRHACRMPESLADGIQVGAMGPLTLPCETAERVVNGVLDGRSPDVRAILVHHRDRLVLEEYFYGFSQERAHPMRSLTKSVISLLAAAAIDRGLLRADEPVVARLGYGSLAHPDARKDRITLTDLLSHQSGLACDDRDGGSPGNEVALYEARDWIRAFLDLPVLTQPGTTGRYCSLGVLAAGRMIELAAGMPLPDFAQEVLFGPLGIPETHWRWTFVLDNSQRHEFGQIHLRPRDMLKLGLLIHHEGRWQGRQVISSSRIKAVIARQSRVDDSDYGLGIWHRWYNVATPTGARRVETIMLSGNGGQKVFIVPSLDLVVVFTGGAFNAESPVNAILARELLPGLLDAQGSDGRQ